jgi:hypothetical protein
MKIEEAIKILLNENYEIFNVEDSNDQLFDNNIHIFSDKKRIIFLKEFRTESSFFDWKNDQAIIASQYNKFSSRQKKNLYFFLVMNFTSKSEKLLLEVNKIEKNYFVCRKYVLKNINDFTKIPFLLNVEQKKQVEFDYIKTFKDTITNIDTLHNNVPLNEQIDKKQYKVIIEKLVNYYFNNDLENLDEEELDFQIKKLLEVGDSIDN